MVVLYSLQIDQMPHRLGLNYLSGTSVSTSTCATTSTWKIVEMSYIDVSAIDQITLLRRIYMKLHSMNNNFDG